MVAISLAIRICFIFLFCPIKAFGQEIYLGCYDKLPGLSPNMANVRSVADCRANSKNEPEAPYFVAVQDSTNCYYGNGLSARVPSSNCNLTCADDEGNCGGKTFFALYTEVPAYRGCYHDGIKASQKVTDREITLAKCNKLCSGHRIQYMGIRDVETCLCFNTFEGLARAPEKHCDKFCDERSRKEKCGGDASISVYAVEFFPGLSKKYTDVFHCQNRRDDLSLTCNEAKCKPGWKGDICNIRDCTVNNGNCGKHKCQESVGRQITSECICEPGFQSSSIYHDCIDIDECKSNPCIEPTETCVNTIGSFTCVNQPIHDEDKKKDGYDDDDVITHQHIDTTTQFNELPDYMPLDSEENGNTGKIVGGVLGLIAVIIIVMAMAVLFYYIFMKRKNKVDDENNVMNSEVKLESSEYESTRINLSDVNEYYFKNKDDIIHQFNRCRKAFDHTQTVASLSENMHKNNFENILPYDHNRVHMKIEDDYINASIVQTYGESSNLTFIAAQGPTLETTEDFWRMTWDSNVKVIVMLTQCYEHDKVKCHQYFPNEGEIEVGDFVVKFHEREERLNFVKRIFKIAHNHEEREVCHFTFTSWMDDSVPENIFSLLNLREKVLSMVDSESHNKVVIHCSDGVGRTGTFIALDYLIRQAEREGCVDFYECLNFLRNQRCNMIQTPDQYALCCRAIAMSHAIGKSTFIPADSFDAFKCKMDKMNDKLLHNQFELIDSEVVEKEAVNKVVINCSSGPIEVIHAPSSQKMLSYVVGVKSSSIVVEDILELHSGIDSIFIMLDKEMVHSDHQQFLRRSGSIQLIESSDFDSYKKYSFKVDKNGGVTERSSGSSDHHSINVGPNAFLLHVIEDVTKSFDVISQLYSVVKSISSHVDRCAITVLSRNGYKDAGFFIAAFNIALMADISREIDIYETVFELRSLQPEMISNFDLYKKLHSFALHVMETSEIVLDTGSNGEETNENN